MLKLGAHPDHNTLTYEKLHHASFSLVVSYLTACYGAHNIMGLTFLPLASVQDFELWFYLYLKDLEYPRPVELAPLYHLDMKELALLLDNME